ncbi:MAG: hypothetical protein QM532_02870 [Cyanobium sp. MAG06]|nr:hypothetical protein [Cyanobium sp. MAG06]
MRKGIEFYIYKYKLSEYKLQIDLACVYLKSKSELDKMNIYRNIILD